MKEADEFSFKIQAKNTVALRFQKPIKLHLYNINFKYWKKKIQIKCCLLRLTGRGEYSQIEILINLADVVLRRHRAVMMFMNHGPAHPLQVRG